MTAGPTRVPRWPFVVLGLMTALTFGGPLAIVFVLQGGANPEWPPDRTVEWVTFGVISGMVFILMMVCLSLALVNRKAIQRRRSTEADRPEVEP